VLKVCANAYNIKVLPISIRKSIIPEIIGPYGLSTMLVDFAFLFHDFLDHGSFTIVDSISSLVSFRSYKLVIFNLLGCRVRIFDRYIIWTLKLICRNKESK
jgi:hypothetical protein